MKALARGLLIIVLGTLTVILLPVWPVIFLYWLAYVAYQALE